MVDGIIIALSPGKNKWYTDLCAVPGGRMNAPVDRYIFISHEEEIVFMTVGIRPFEIGDAESICRLNAEEMGYDFPLEQTAKKLTALAGSPKDRIFVAVADSAVVGYVHANNYDLIYAPHMKNIMGIAVAKRYRRRGIGKALLDAVEAWAKRTGAHEFYRRCGYGCEKEQINFKKFFS